MEFVRLSGRMNIKAVVLPVVNNEIAAKGGLQILSICTVVAVLCHFSTTRCLAGDAVFSRDGQRIYAIASGEKKPALREINLRDQTTRTISLSQLPDQEWLRGVTRSDDERISYITQKSLWTFDPQSGRLTKIKDAPKGGSFWRVYYGRRTR